MEEIYLKSKDDRFETQITKYSTGFHFQDVNDKEEVWIAEENIKELICFLVNNL